MFPPTIALDAMLGPIKSIFAKRKFDIVLHRLAILDQRLTYINQEYDRARGFDSDFLDYVSKIFWKASLSGLSAPSRLLLVNREEKLRFLEGFKTLTEDAEHSIFRKVLSSVRARGI